MSLSNVKWYVGVVGFLAIAWMNSQFFGAQIIDSASHGPEGSSAPIAIAIAMACIAVLFGAKFAKEAKLPVYALYLAIGVAIGSFLAPLEGSVAEILKLLAMMVLTKAGLELSLKEFGKVAVQVTILSIFGVLATGWLFAETLVLIGPYLGTVIPATGANLTGAAIASTDPAAIVPVLASLYFVSKKAEQARYLANAEAAGTDAGGTVLVAGLIAIASGGMMVDVRSTGFGGLFTADSGIFLAKQIGWGTVAGLVGAAILWIFQKVRGKDTEGAAYKDILAFIAASFISYEVANELHGNVFLAGFLAGLFLNVEQKIEHAQHAYDENVDELVIPFIFVFGGLLVDISAFIKYAPIGIVSTLILIWFIRPGVVNACLRPFTFIRVGGEPMSTNEEIKFLSSVRQIGAIGIVLAADIAHKNIPGTEAVVPITAWAAFITLLYCTPKVKSVAIKVGLATEDKPVQAGLVEA